MLIADTYNGAVRRYDPSTDMVTTVATGLGEPSDIVVNASGDVIVVESSAHRLTRLSPGALEAAGVKPDGTRMKMERPETMIAPGEFILDVVFMVPDGQKLDDSFGPPTNLLISATPPSLLLSGAGESSELSRRLVVSKDATSGTLSVDVRAATCDATAEHPACHLAAQSWGIPVRVSPDGETRLDLAFRQVDAD